jgi:outer membrane protein W
MEHQQNGFKFAAKITILTDWLDNCYSQTGQYKHLMKRITLLFVSIFAMSGSSFAQEDDLGNGRRSGVPRQSSTPWHLGVFFAPNVSWMKPNNSKSNDGVHKVVNEGSKVGYNWGLMADYYFSDNYAIETGFDLNTTGGIISTTIVPAMIPAGESYVKTSSFNYTLQYIQVPFNLKLRSDELGPGLKLFGQLGVTGGININKKATYAVTYYDVNLNADKVATGEKERITGNLTISPLMFSLNVGGGVEYPVGEKLSLYGGIFFNNGFAPDATNPANYTLGYDASGASFKDSNTRLNNFSLRLGVFF